MCASDHLNFSITTWHAFKNCEESSNRYQGTKMTQTHRQLLYLFLFGNILEAVIASDDVGLADLAKVLGQLAGGDNCVFKCPRGKIFIRQD